MFACSAMAAMASIGEKAGQLDAGEQRLPLGDQAVGQAVGAIHVEPGAGFFAEFGYRQNRVH